MTTGRSLDLVYLLIKVVIARVLVVHVIHSINIDQVEPGARGSKVTPSDLPPGTDVLHGADPQGPVEQRHPVQAEEAEEIREQSIPPPVKPYSMGNGGIKYDKQ